MAKIKPFKALRPKPELAAQVAAVPYDVVDTAKALLLAQGNPMSFLHVSRAEIDLQPGVDPYSDPVYATAAANLHRLVDQQILIREERDCLYLYQQTMGQHRQMGLVACCAVDDYDANVIRKHELTRADKELDRTRHVDVTNVNSGPVFLTYRAEQKLDALVDQIVAQQRPLYDFVASDGIGHTVYRVDDPRHIEALVSHFAAIERLYVADGHHRSASAARVGRERRQREGNAIGEREHDWFLAVLFPHDQLQILPYNRVVQDLAGMDSETFLDRVRQRFTVEKVEVRGYSPQQRHDIGMYLDGSWWRIVPLAGTYPAGHPTGSLDAAILQQNLLAPLLGIEDPRTAKRINFVGGIHGSKELERLVDGGGYAVAFALYPVSLEELMSVADADLIMPPKSTWFEPKLRSGLLVHELS
ncbi:MAG: DUF1015 domain-containing protein [Bradymonadales bacterium]|nr:DUF1015 domain-containing protein [Bradymonadales bacterium]